MTSCNKKKQAKISLISKYYEVNVVIFNFWFESLDLIGPVDEEGVTDP